MPCLVHIVLSLLLIFVPDLRVLQNINIKLTEGEVDPMFQTDLPDANANWVIVVGGTTGIGKGMVVCVETGKIEIKIKAEEFDQ